jgi:hypothetical protein
VPAARRAALWFLAQSLVIAGWWLSLWWLPSLRPWFTVGTWPVETLLCFVVPDLLVLVGGGALAAQALWHTRPGGCNLAYLVAGASLYATLWCLGANLFTGDGWLATGLMVPHTGITLGVVRGLR